jgi:hypothetical protein
MPADRARRNAATHGSPGYYQRRGCRCDTCVSGWREYQRGREDVPRFRARNLADGLTSLGKERTRPYDQRALDLIARFGLRPDPRWMP